MYDNIGGKIKGLAVAAFIVEAIIAIIYGAALMAYMNLIGLLVMIAGPIAAWLSSWVLYGFGELIEKVSDIERNTRGGERKSEAQAKVDSKRINKIERRRSQDLITEEEYQQVILKDQ